MLDLCSTCSDQGECPFSDPTVKSMFEIHVTVETSDPMRFRDVCMENQIKPILIEFQERHSGLTDTHVMTSQRVKGSVGQMTDEINRICSVMTQHGLKIIRKKVEATPDMAELLDAVYFESHLSFTVAPDGVDRLRDECGKLGMHLSRNAFKTTGDHVVMMGTYRSYTPGASQFDSEIRNIKSNLETVGYPSEKLIIECCILDDKASLDDQWLGIVD